LSERIESVVDFGDMKVFGGVTTYPAIVTMAKPQADGAADGTLRFLKINPPLPQDLTIHFAQNAARMPRSRLTSKSWQFELDPLAALRTTIRNGKRTLGEVYGAPLYGIKTGLNDAFVVDRETRDRLTALDSKSQELLVPFLKGENLKKWRVEPQEQWLINIPRNAINIDDFPAIKHHLLPFKERLEKRATDQSWYELQQAQLAYQRMMRLPKIVYPDISHGPKFCLDARDFFFGNTVYFIPTSEWQLLGLLNSEQFGFTVR
jgi:hypothetical protein